MPTLDKKRMATLERTKMLTTLSILTALSIVLMLFIRFPIFPAAVYLEYEPMDIPILIAGFAYGPAAGLTVALVSCLIQGFTVSFAIGGWVGVLMHFIASGTLVTVASLIYRKKSDVVGIIIGLVSGVIAMTAIMVPANMIITPAFYGVPLDLVMPLIIPIIVPFNLIKAGVNAAVAFALFEPLRLYLFKRTLTKRMKTDEVQKVEEKND